MLISVLLLAGCTGPPPVTPAQSQPQIPSVTETEEPGLTPAPIEPEPNTTPALTEPEPGPSPNALNDILITDVTWDSDTQIIFL